MTWNHRIVRTDHPDWVWAKDQPAGSRPDLSTVPRYRYGVHEAHYDSDADPAGPDAPHSWTVAPVELWTDDLHTLRSYLAEALAACDAEIINDTDDTP